MYTNQPPRKKSSKTRFQTQPQYQTGQKPQTRAQGAQFEESVLAPPTKTIRKRPSAQYQAVDLTGLTNLQKGIARRRSSGAHSNPGRRRSAWDDRGKGYGPLPTSLPRMQGSDGRAHPVRGFIILNHQGENTGMEFNVDTPVQAAKKAGTRYNKKLGQIPNPVIVYDKLTGRVYSYNVGWIPGEEVVNLNGRPVRFTGTTFAHAANLPTCFIPPDVTNYPEFGRGGLKRAKDYGEYNLERESQDAGFRNPETKASAIAARKRLSQAGELQKWTSQSNVNIRPPEETPYRYLAQQLGIPPPARQRQRQR